MPALKQVYLNGAYLAPEQAAISPFDRGFIFGDGVYEVIPVYGGRLFRLAHHLERLEHSLGAIRIGNPLTAGQWTEVFGRLIQAQGGGDQYVYLQVTRGVAPRDHSFPPGVPPTVFAYAQRLSPVAPEMLRDGIAAVTLPDIRWARCDIKATALLANVLFRQQAVEQQAYEAILIRDGSLTEGAASNIFVVHRGRLLTPPKGREILPGITRDLVLELARTQAIPCAETRVGEAELRTAEEIWLTSSTRELLPITRLDGRLVGDGRPGALFARVYSLYQDYKAAFRAGRVE